MSLLLGSGGAYARDKNISARVCAKMQWGGLCARGAYLRDTAVKNVPFIHPHSTVESCHS